MGGCSLQLFLFLSHQRFSQRLVRISFEKGPIASLGEIRISISKEAYSHFPRGWCPDPPAHPCYTSCCGPNLHTLCVHLSNLSSRWSFTGHVFNSHRQAGPFSCRISLCTVPLPFLSCSSYPVVSMHFQLEFENMWILIGWCLKPSDLDLQRFQKRVEPVSGGQELILIFQ